MKSNHSRPHEGRTRNRNKSWCNIRNCQTSANVRMSSFVFNKILFREQEWNPGLQKSPEPNRQNMTSHVHTWLQICRRARPSANPICMGDIAEWCFPCMPPLYCNTLASLAFGPLLHHVFRRCSDGGDLQHCDRIPFHKVSNDNVNVWVRR